MINKKGQEQIITNQIVEKKSHLWLWILIIIIVIALILGAYFLFLSGSDGGNSIMNGGNSIPQPPALPQCH